MTKLHINKDTGVLENDGSLASAMILGCKGKIIIKSPLFKGGKREITKIEKAEK